MASIKIAEARKSYGALEVLHGVSIDIEDGEFLILVGPSGCGKSTLLRMIAGLESITAGDIIVDDLVINKLPPRERDIAMVFQSYALYPHMTVRKNMSFSLKMAKKNQTEIAEKVQMAAEILDLEELLERKPSQLSGGQRQRVAMGRAIVRDPKLFLFDEPLSNLDAKLRIQMRSEIKELHRRLKSTIVYVTHDQVEAMTMADRIVVMNAGEIEQVGTPMDLYDKPETLFVASFIGSPGMNLISGKISSNGDISEFVSNNGTRISLADHVPSIADGDAVVLGLRPENIVIKGDGIALGEATIRTVEPTGSETLLSVNLGLDSLTVLNRDRMRFSAGQKLKLISDTADFHFFHPNTGKRIS